MINSTQSPQRQHFYSIMSVATSVVIFLGFANTYGRRFIDQTEHVTPYVHFHALLFSFWVLAFVLQCYFVFSRQMKWHIRLGHASVILAGFMLGSATVTAIDSAKTGHLGIPGVEFPDPSGFLLLNLSSAFIFTSLVGLGWIYRQQIQIHKRLMLMAAVIGLAPPGISRLPLLSGNTPLIAAATLLFILAGPIYDWRTQGRPHKVYYLGLSMAIFILPPVVTTLSQTSIWQSISQKLIYIFIN